ARLIAQAQEEARAIILAAETANETLPTAEPTARAQIADLEVTRSRLQADVAALESHVTDRRASIKGLLDELQRRVDEGFDGRIGEWPSPGEGTFSDERDEYYDDLTGVVDIDEPFSIEEPIDTTSAAVDTANFDEPDPDPDPEPEQDPEEPVDSGEIIVDLTPEAAEADTPGDMLDTGSASERQEELAVPGLADA